MSDVSNKTVSIYIDQTAANAALVKLQASADALNKKIADLQANGKSAVAALKQLDSVNANIKNVQDQISNGLAPTLKEQINLVSQLRNEIALMSASDPNYDAKLAEYQKENALLTQMKANIAGVKQANDLLNGSLAKIGEFFVSYLSVTSVFSAIKDFLSSSVDVANKAEDALSKLQNILENIGRLDVFERLKEQAAALSAQFKTFTATDVIDVFQKLITFGKLTENQINQLTPVIIDFAAKQKISLADATNTITQALEGNNRGLREYGINMKNAADLSDRMSIIMTELKPRVEGAAAAFGETTQGQIKATQVQIDNLKEQIGDELQPALKAFYTSVQEALQGIEVFYEKTTVAFSILKQTISDSYTLMKDFATFNTNDVKNQINERQKLAELDNIRLQNVKDITQAQQTANSIAGDAATKPLAEQKELFKENLALAQASAEAWKQMEAAGTQNSAAGHALALQVITDAKTVAALANVIKETTDKRVLGVGGTDPADQTKYNDLLQAAQDFNKKIRDLQEESTTSGESEDQKQIDDAKHKYDEIIIAYEQMQKKLAGSGIKLSFDLSDIQKLESNEIAALIAKQIQDALKIAEQNFQSDIQNEYETTQANSAKFYDNLKILANNNYAQGKISYAEYQNQLKQIDKDALAEKLRNAEADAASVKQALDDELALRKEVSTNEANDQIAAYKKAQDEILKIDQANVINATTLADKKAALKKEYDDEIANETLTDADKEKIHAEYLAAIKKMDDDANAASVKTIENMLGYAKQALDILDKFSQAQTNKEQQLLKTQLAGYTAQEAANQKLYNAKLITAQELAVRNTALTQQSDAASAAATKKEFERQQKIQIAQTLINGAAGEVKLWVDPGFPAAIPLAIALGAETLAQVAFIASQNPSYATGGKVQKLGDGKITAQQNIPVQHNGDDVLATVKRGEVILNEKQQKALGGDKIFQRIGVPGFGTGGYVPKYVTTPMPAINYGSVSKSIEILRFASGGLVTSSNSNAAINNNDIANALAQSNSALLQSQQINLALMNVVQNLNDQISNGITTTFSLSDLQQAQALKARILKAASFA